VGASLGIGFIDSTIQGCNLCNTQFAYQGILGLDYNATPALRIGLEGRCYGTTTNSNSPYSNNNIMALLSISYKFGQLEAPPPPPAVAPPSFMVFFDWDRSNHSR
jgi:OmpA-OmpF porin, OOP family